jgi:mono/diheme cytochrome c family protein
MLFAVVALLQVPLAGADPRSDYLMHCAGCHLADGSGLPPEVPSLAGPLGRIVSSPAGRDYVARVPGAAQAPLSDEALAAVLNWLLLEFNRATLPANFQALRPGEVARSRARVLADPLKLRNELWPGADGY